VDYTAASVTDVGIEDVGRMMFVIMGGNRRTPRENSRECHLFTHPKRRALELNSGLHGRLIVK